VSLLLFDIDGTLLLSGGAGIRAMTSAFEDCFDVAEAFANSDTAGRTDRFLLSHALTRAGIPDVPEHHERFRAAYLLRLEEEILKQPQTRYGLMPGVQQLLQALQDRDSLHVALLTGNFEPAAHVKLAHFGIAHFFEWGVFGEESSDRNELARIARQRAHERSIPQHAIDRIVVIGDTPHDIACGRAIDARVIAVATGNYSEEQLRAAGADVTLTDLSETERVIALAQHT
jgi:phosphoglycolate phosphatase-like HAD superfamily hydrolase